MARCSPLLGADVPGHEHLASCSVAPSEDLIPHFKRPPSLPVGRGGRSHAWHIIPQDSFSGLTGGPSRVSGSVNARGTSPHGVSNNGMAQLARKVSDSALEQRSPLEDPLDCTGGTAFPTLGKPRLADTPLPVPPSTSATAVRQLPVHGKAAERAQILSPPATIPGSRFPRRGKPDPPHGATRGRFPGARSPGGAAREYSSHNAINVLPAVRIAS